MNTLTLNSPKENTKVKQKTNQNLANKFEDWLQKIGQLLNTQGLSNHK
ncbi:hypothetical protein [Paraglaciecola sp.]